MSRLVSNVHDLAFFLSVFRYTYQNAIMVIQTYFQVFQNLLKDSADLTELFLMNTSLNDLSMDLNLIKFEKLIKLDLSFNTIRKIPDGYFVNNKEVNYINMSHNLILHFDRGQNLKELDLSFNLIESIDDRAFYNLGDLEFLPEFLSWPL
jgi:Leucine-rich repeat (LRR) protein